MPHTNADEGGDDSDGDRDPAGEDDRRVKRNLDRRLGLTNQSNRKAHATEEEEKLGDNDRQCDLAELPWA